MSEIYLSVDRDQLTGGIQISINDKGGGYRIAGPKYCGQSVTLRKHILTVRDVDEISRYLRAVKRKRQSGPAAAQRSSKARGETHE